MGTDAQRIVDLNVGGVLYTTSVETLTKEEGSVLHSMFTGEVANLLTDSKGRVFFDRDGVLFRYILDYLRNGRLLLPANFQETERLVLEAEWFKLPRLVQQVPAHTPLLPAQGERGSQPAESRGVTTRLKRPSATDLSGVGGAEGYIVVGYRGTFAFGRDMSDVKFRKLTRILVHGKVLLCKEVFKDGLNESRDPDRGNESDRYTARYFLNHTFLEQAFDQLCDAGFSMVGCCGSGTSAPTLATDLKPGQNQIEEQWNHYNEFVFVRKQNDNNDYCPASSPALPPPPTTSQQMFF